MDCSRFEEVVHDLDRPGTPGLAVREVALAHAESCSHCAQLMTDAESLDFSLHTIALREAHSEASPRVEVSLLDEFRRERAAVSRSRRGGRMAALGVAAAILIALGVSLRHDFAPIPARSAPEMGTAEEAAANQVSPVEVTENRTADTQTATAFVPLPYAADPATLNNGAVVRVLLSRSALASMGLPVADVAASERVPADIVLSEDGAPQAIRLVAQSTLDQ